MKTISSDKSVRLNDEITAQEVRLIGVNGEQLGVKKIQEALQAALAAELDLVEISPNANPPVCRVMDYGKFVFEQNKQKALQRKRQKQIQIKEIKFRPGTEIGDYQVKLRNLIRFLEDGDKVKITLRFRGREISHTELGVRLLEKLRMDIDKYGTVEQMPKLEGRQMVMVISPKKK